MKNKLMIWLCSFIASHVNFKHVFLLIFTFGELANNIYAKSWWENAVFYQVYTRSFMDSNSDGVGDINGVTEKLDHLSDAGVNALWLTTILASPQSSLGNDISNFEQVDLLFGNNKDLKNLLIKAKDIGIKIIIDLIPNHTSDQHEWFIRSKARDGMYENYYVWHPGTVDEHNKTVPPNNWQSMNYGSAWEWNEQRQEFYLHQFSKSEPELNYRNSIVVMEMKAILLYWLSMGVNGFHLDAISYLFEEKNYPNEPVNEGATDPFDYSYTDHIYTKNHIDTLDLVFQLREICDNYMKRNGGEDIVLMIEATANITFTQLFYGSRERKGAHIPFNYLFLDQLSSTSSAKDFHEYIHSWYNNLEEWQVPNWMLGNHRTHRVGTRFGENMMNVLNTLIMTLPGIAITYYGEEIGMVDYNDMSCLETYDEPECRDSLEKYKLQSHDPAKTPFQWDSSVFAGFKTNTIWKTWLGINPEYVKRNLKKQVEAPNSVYKYYKQLTDLRRNPIFTDGDFKSTYIGENVFVYSRSHPDHGKIFILLNVNKFDEIVDISTFDFDFPESLQVVLASPLAPHVKDVLVTSSNIILGDYEVLILQPKLEPPKRKNKEWWQTAVFYQIYARSFKDSNGDGVGDLQGIISKLDYLKDLGITATWLSPIYKSPMADFGYDISDFEKVDPIFGTDDDLVELFEKAKALGIKVIMDFVPNHTSDEHKWFVKSVAKDPKFANFYAWHDAKYDMYGKRIPPNNWRSFFGGSAWEWNNERKQYYLHQFHKKQPDLNYRETAVLAAMKQVLQFWLDKGADGFRMDAVNHLFEIEDFRDNPINPDETDEQSSDYVLRHYTSNLKETYEVIYEFRNFIDEWVNERNATYPRVMIVESFANISYTMKYSVSEDGKNIGAHFPFNFNLITKADATSNASQVKELIESWITLMPEESTANWVLGNHDQPRVGSRYGEGRIDAMNILSLTLPGIAVTYNGEEIGMVDYRDILWKDTVDPQACNLDDPYNYKYLSRDPQRTPFQWDDSKYAGFTELDATQTWLPVNPNYKEINLAKQKSVGKSHYSIYKQLVGLRKNDVFINGELKMAVLNERVISYVRKLDNDWIVVVISFSGSTEDINLNELMEVPTIVQVQVSSMNSNYKTGDIVPSNQISLLKHDGLILSACSSSTKFAVSSLITFIVVIGMIRLKW